MKLINIKKLRVLIIVRARKRLQARLKINKAQVMGIFVCINVSKQYYIQRMNARAQKKRRSPVR